MNNKFSEYYVVKASELDLTDKTREEIEELYRIYLEELDELTDRVREETNFEGSQIALIAIRLKKEFADENGQVEVDTLQYLNGMYGDFESLIKNSKLYKIFRDLIKGNNKQEEK